MSCAVTRSHREKYALASAAGAVLFLPQVLLGATRTENFDLPTAPVNWVSFNTTAGGSNYGFRTTDNTGQASGAGEAGGTFARSTNRGYYADNTIGTLTQDDVIHGEGEFSYGNGATGNTDTAFGHLDTGSLDIGFVANILGIGIFEGTPESAGFRFCGQIYSDAGSDIHGTRTHHANGQYKFTYDWNPNTDTLTAVLKNTGGTPLQTDTIVATGVTFSLDAFGFAGGIQGGSPNSGQTYEYYVDAATYTEAGPPPPPGWFVDATGDWLVGTNWIGGVPNAVDATANFGSIITAPRLIYANSGVTVGTLTFDNSNTYLLSGLGSLTFQVSTGSGLVDVQSGTHKINLPVTVASNTTVNIDTGATLKVSDPVTVNAGIDLSVTGGGSLVMESTITVLSGGGFALAPSSGGGTLRADGLALGSSSSLDLNNNDLVVNNGNFAEIQALVAAGFQNTSGIISSTSDGSQILAVFDNALVGLADWPPGSGNAIDAGAVVGKYTYFGDVSLDGQVTGDDYATIDANLDSTPLPGVAWMRGDANLDGVVTGDDYTVIDANLGHGAGNPLSASRVPEPAGLLIVTMAGLMIASARRRR